MVLTKEILDAFDVSLSCLSGLIVISNMAVIVLISLNKSIRTYTNGLVVSLALSDILTGGILFPVHIGARRFPGLPYLNCIMLLLGVANVCCVTYDRYLSISSPLTYALDIRIRFKVMMTLCWSLPILYALVPLFWNANPTLLVHKVYIAVLEICGVVIPFLFIFVIYCYIFNQVRKCNIRLKRDLTDKETSKKRRKALFSEAKVARVFATVAILFLLSWAPILYLTTVRYFSSRSDLAPAELHLAAFYALALGSLVNPVLYCFLKPDIKATLRRFARKKWRHTLRASFNTRTATANIVLVSNTNTNENTKF